MACGQNLDAETRSKTVLQRQMHDKGPFQGSGTHAIDHAFCEEGRISQVHMRKTVDLDTDGAPMPMGRATHAALRITARKVAQRIFKLNFIRSRPL
jgi:hypothetical protein